MSFQLFDNEIFKMALVRDENSVKIRIDGSSEFTIASFALFRCECRTCILSGLAAMKNIMDHYKKEHEITDTDVLKQLDDMGGANGVESLPHLFH